MSESLNWVADIVPNLKTRRDVEGGYTAAIRGVVEIGNKKLFVKIGQSEQEKSWANKERAVYHFLEAHGYPYAPRLLSETDGAFAVDDLSEYDWSAEWSVDKVRAALHAMDALAALSDFARDEPIFNEQVGHFPNGWEMLLNDNQRLVMLSDQHPEFTVPTITSFFDRTKSIDLSGDSLVHNDVRNDNFAYDSESETGYLVDWNWAEMGNVAIDKTAFLVSVQLHGLDVQQHFAELVDPTAALWLAGFWFDNGTQPPPRSDERAQELRTHQIKSAEVALNFALINE